MIDKNRLIDILRSAKTAQDIYEHTDELVEIMPAIEIMVGFDQQNHAHQYDLWMHCINTVINLSKDIDDDMVYLAALLHDIGKPDCQCTKEGDTNMHYYGHPLRSMEIVRDEVIPSLDKNGIVLPIFDIKRLLYYVEYHDDQVSLRLKHLRRHLDMGVSFEDFQKLMLLEIADAKAHIMLPIIEQRIEICTMLAGDIGRDNYRRILAGE